MDYLAMIRIITYRLAMLAIFVVHFYAMCETADEQLMQKVPRPYLSDANDWREILYVAVPSYILLLVAFWHSQKWAAHVYIIGTQAGFLHGVSHFSWKFRPSDGYHTDTQKSMLTRSLFPHATDGRAHPSRRGLDLCPHSYIS